MVLRKIFALAALALASMPLPAAEGPGIQLNRLQQKDNDCVAYLVVENPTGMTYTSLKMDLVLFQTNGVIERRLSLDLSPVLPSKTRVSLYQFADLNCDSLGKVLVNEITECQAETALPDCINQFHFDSLAGIPLFK